MVRLVRFGHPLKALVSISVTESGKVMLVNPLHSLYLQPIVTQYLVCNKSEIWP